jgi:CheY-like chemotaxis protein
VKLVEQSIIEASPYHIIFMDYVMPHMPGPEATTMIRNLGFLNPIIGVTGNAFEEAKTSFVNAGATSVLVKPVNLTTLTNVLHGLSPFLAFALFLLIFDLETKQSSLELGV